MSNRLLGGDGMSFTSLYAEVSIIGLEVFVWLVLLFEVVTGGGKVFGLVEKVSSNIGLSVFVLGLIYVLGCIVDRLADLVFGGMTGKIRATSGIETESSLLIPENNKEKEYRSYIRMRIVILRSTSINLPLISVFGSIYATQHTQETLFICVILVAGLVFSILSVLGTKNSIKDFYDKARMIEKKYANASK